jgi:hypothetical protein
MDVWVCPAELDTVTIITHEVFQTIPKFKSASLGDRQKRNLRGAPIDDLENGDEPSKRQETPSVYRFRSRPRSTL